MASSVYIVCDRNGLVTWRAIDVRGWRIWRASDARGRRTSWRIESSSTYRMTYCAVGVLQILQISYWWTVHICLSATIVFLTPYIAPHVIQLSNRQWKSHRWKHHIMTCWRRRRRSCGSSRTALSVKRRGGMYCFSTVDIFSSVWIAWLTLPNALSVCVLFKLRRRFSSVSTINSNECLSL